ncbi:siderophore-interacting protein [Streptomyces sp. NPDC055210]
MTVTLGGEDVRHLQRSGFDQAGRLFFADPDDDATEVFLPSSERWILQLTLQVGKQRPQMRTHSIRRFRPEASAFDIEISLHADNSPGAAGPGTRWARAAEPGTRVAFIDARHRTTAWGARRGGVHPSRGPSVYGRWRVPHVSRQGRRDAGRWSPSGPRNTARPCPPCCSTGDAKRLPHRRSNILPHRLWAWR